MALCGMCFSAPAEFMCTEEHVMMCGPCDGEAQQDNPRRARVELSAMEPENHPTCDICQEKPGLIFCHQDRSLMCTTCDLAVHQSTPMARKHDRFPFAAARVGICAVQPAGVSRASAMGRPSRAAREQPKAPKAEEVAPAPVKVQQQQPVQVAVPQQQQQQPVAVQPVAPQQPQHLEVPDVEASLFNFGLVPDQAELGFGLADFDDLFGMGEMALGKRKAGYEDYGAYGAKQARTADIYSNNDFIVPDFFAAV